MPLFSYVCPKCGRIQTVDSSTEKCYNCDRPIYRPAVSPKGKAAKKAKKVNYRTSIYAYVRKYCPEIQGTSGVIRMEIEDFGSVSVNSRVCYDSKFEIKPGDTVACRDYLGNWKFHHVTAEEIEGTW